MIVMGELNESVKVNSEYTKSVIKAMYLTSNGTIFETVEQALIAYKTVCEELSVEEIMALGQLHNEDNPITFIGVITSEYRVVQQAFLERMGELREELMELSDLELKKLILENYKNDNYRKRAEKLFFIQE